MSPRLQKEPGPFKAEMMAAIIARERMAGHVLNVLRFEEFPGPTDSEAVRCQFWLGTKMAESATFTFTCTSELSIAENLSDMEDFVSERFSVATIAPVV
jgi:hypothetical protein